MLRMKKGLSCVLLIIGVVFIANAQNKSFNRFYNSFGLSCGGAPNTNFTTKDFAIRSCEVGLGFRFTPNFATFALSTADINLMNATTTRNYNLTGTLGVGAIYSFDIGHRSYIEPVITCSSTYQKSDLNYLTPKFEVRWGVKIPWGGKFNFGQYVGIGIQYIHPYDSSTVPNMAIAYATIGFYVL